MTDPLDLARLLDTRAPRYTSYPPANRFGPAVGAPEAARWLEAIPAGARVSLYVHVPWCRRLCWFCACRTQGTAVDRPLAPYVARLLRELAAVGRHLDPGVVVAAIHLGGGTPTILPPDLVATLMGALRAFRPLAPDLEVAVEIDPTEVDEARLAALGAAGLTRASMGVQDFDPRVQAAIGRAQDFARTRDVAAMARAAGARSLNLDLLYGLPHQTAARLGDTLQKVLALGPDRLALYGYAHVPWMARRQALIDEAALPGPAERLALMDGARATLLSEGFEAVGIDHFARPGDGLARAAREGRLRRSFQGYTDDGADWLIGLGASAVSRLPGGWAQNAPTSSAWAQAIDAGRLGVVRGHAMTAEDRLVADLIERVMCRFAIDLDAVARAHGLPRRAVEARCEGLRARLGGRLEADGATLRLGPDAAALARLAARCLDPAPAAEGHAQAS